MLYCYIWSESGLGSMRGLRESRRPWGWLALFALALQLGLSFGHVHAGHGGNAAFVAPAPNIAATSQPADEDDDEAHCSICAINALLSGAQVAAAPVIPTPAVRM